MPHRALDKLWEAQFFLERLREAEAKSDAFRFYFSALVNAARSVTWVLQSDLRGDHGEAFDEWWSANRGRLGLSGLSFSTLRDLRNTMVKQGNRLPVRLFAQEFDEGVVQRLEVQRETLSPKGTFVEVKLSLRPGEATFPVVEGESEEEEERRTAQEVGELLFQAFEELGSDFDFQFEGFMLDEDMPPLAPSDVIASVEEYLTELEGLLKEAQALFGTTEGYSLPKKNRETLGRRLKR